MVKGNLRVQVGGKRGICTQVGSTHTSQMLASHVGMQPALIYLQMNPLIYLQMKKKDFLWQCVGADLLFQHHMHSVASKLILAI